MPSVLADVIYCVGIHLCYRCAMDNSEQTTLRLNADDIAVLFDLTHRWEDQGRVSEPADRAEQQALSNLTAVLEPHVPFLFASDYQVRRRAAKERLLPSD